MNRLLGVKLSSKGKYWLDAGEKGNKFLWVFFVPIDEEVVAVVEERFNRDEASTYSVKWWDMKDLEKLLSEYWRGANRFKGYKLNKMEAIERNWTEKELKEVKRWWEIRRKHAKAEELTPQEWELYTRGIRKGFYLLLGF